MKQCMRKSKLSHTPDTPRVQFLPEVQKPMTSVVSRIAEWESIYVVDFQSEFTKKTSSSARRIELNEFLVRFPVFFQSNINQHSLSEDNGISIESYNLGIKMLRSVEMYGRFDA